MVFWHDDDEDPPKSTLDIPNCNKAMLQTEHHFRLVSMGGAVCYLSLVGISYAVADRYECVEELKSEQASVSIAAASLFVTLLLQLLPIFLHRNGHPPFSGVVFVAIVVQSVAMVTNAVMAFGSPPVLIDPVTGARVSLLRWCECHLREVIQKQSSEWRSSRSWHGF